MACTCSKKPVDLMTTLNKITLHPDTHKYKFICNPQIRDSVILSENRVHRLGLNPRFARTYDVSRMEGFPPVPREGEHKCRNTMVLPQRWNNFYDIRHKFDHANPLLPFSSIQKNIFGVRFSFDTDNRLKKQFLPVGPYLPEWRPLAKYDQYT